MAQRHPHPDVEGVKKALDSITIPEANLKQMTAGCALTYWIAASHDSDHHHKGISKTYDAFAAYLSEHERTNSANRASHGTALPRRP